MDLTESKLGLFKYIFSDLQWLSLFFVPTSVMQVFTRILEHGDESVWRTFLKFVILFRTFRTKCHTMFNFTLSLKEEMFLHGGCMPRYPQTLYAR